MPVPCCPLPKPYLARMSFESATQYNAQLYLAQPLDQQGRTVSRGAPLPHLSRNHRRSPPKESRRYWPGAGALMKAADADAAINHDVDAS